MLRSTSWIKRPGILFGATLVVMVTAFLCGVGLGPDRLPFPPESDFSDAVTSHWPDALFLRHAIVDDHAFPLWRPLLMSGQPFAANPLNKVWYPPQWLVLVLPPVTHLNVLIGLHLLIAGIGAWMWGRRTGLDIWPAALTGFVYAFVPRLIAAVGAGHLDLMYAAAWFPWVLWAVERVLDARSGWWLGAFAALCFLADVRLSAYVFAFTAVYTLWRVSDRRNQVRQVVPKLLGAGLLAGGLTAVQWVPLLLYRSDLSRGDISLDDAAVNSMKPGEWVGLLIGNHGGAHETLVYVGVSTLVLALAALLMRPRRFAFWGVALLVIMFYAMGDQFVVWTALNRLIPPLRWWRGPPRVWFIGALILPYLAGWGAQLLAEHPPDRRAARLSVVALLGGGLVCGAFSTLTLSSSIELTALIGTFALPAVALVMLLAIFGKVPARGIVILFVIVAVVDVLWIDRTLVEGRSKSKWLEPYRELADFLTDDGAVRVYSPSYSLPQQAAAQWNIAQFGGVDPFQFAAYVRAAEAATGVHAAGYSVTIPAYPASDDAEKSSETEILKTANRNAPLDPALLGQWAVTHIVSAFELDADGLQLAGQVQTPEGTVFIYHNLLAPAVTLDWDGPNRVTVRVADSLDGPLYAVANGRWQDDPDLPGLPGVASGSSWIFEYDSREVWLSLLAAGVLLLAAVGVTLKRA